MKKYNYTIHLNEHSFGSKQKCAFNNLSDFHVYENVACDIMLMHDMFEGID